MSVKMCSIISCPLAALLTLCTGVAAVTVWLVIHKPEDNVHPARVRETSTTLPPEAFTPLPKGGLWDTGAGHLHDEYYRAWDGSEVCFSHLRAKSPAHAARQLRKDIEGIYTGQEAVRNAIIDGGGKKVGERVAGLRRTDTEGRERAAVLWTEGPNFFTIEGWSMERVLEFERQKVKR